jgi:predicted DNA-binding protein (MmcQ/YjbR family)
MLSKIAVNKLLKKYDNITKYNPYGPNIDVYFLGEEMFALVYKNNSPIQISLRCDRLLARHLKEKYETVMGGKDLNPNKWITVILSGQLSVDEIDDLIRHSYEITIDLQGR